MESQTEEKSSNIIQTYLQKDLKDFCHVSKKSISIETPLARSSKIKSSLSKPGVDLRIHLNAHNEIKYGENLKIECLSNTGFYILI